MIAFLDLGRLHRSMADELRAAVDRVVDGSSFVGGAEVAAFEEAFAAAHGARGAVGCGSGTDALVLALHALGVGPGDEVVVPDMTFVATAEAVVHVGAVPVVAPVDPNTLLLDEAGVAAVRTDKTAAVVPVHLYGHLVPFDRIRRWREDGLVVVEDAAQAHLGHWAGAPVGSVGHAACFSFYPGKNLGAFGDGGAVISRDPALLDDVRLRRDHGRRSKYVHDVPGWCSRLDGLQAAVLAVKLRRLPEWTAARQALADRYQELLPDLVVPWEPGAVHHLLVVQTEARDRLAAELGGRDIVTGVHYPVPLSRQPWLAPGVRQPCGDLGARVLSLPMDPLMDPAEVDAVVAAVDEVLGR